MIARGNEEGGRHEGMCGCEKGKKGRNGWADGRPDIQEEIVYHTIGRVVKEH